MSLRIAHYAQQRDIQMAAMLCCAFGSRTENQDGYKAKHLSKSANISVSISISIVCHDKKLMLIIIDIAVNIFMFFVLLLVYMNFTMIVSPFIICKI